MSYESESWRGGRLDTLPAHAPNHTDLWWVVSKSVNFSKDKNSDV